MNLLNLFDKGAIAHHVTFGAYNTHKFLEYLQTKVVPTLDKQRFILMCNVPCRMSREIQQAF